MFVLPLLLLLQLLLTYLEVVVMTTVVEEEAKLDGRLDIVQLSRAPTDELHTIVFARKQNNLELLESMLLSASDPHHPHYGKHLTKHEVNAITSNEEATHKIYQFLRKHHINILNSTYFDDYIPAVSTINKWEELFGAEFYVFQQTTDPFKKFIRCLKYSLPDDISHYVETAFNTVQIPDIYTSRRATKVLVSPLMDVLDTNIIGYTTPSLINNVYRIENNVGSKRGSQAVYAILDQQMSPSDLTYFQQRFELPIESINSSVGGHVSDTACAFDINDCIEANLDVQYLMAVSQSVPTTFYYWEGNDVWLDWIVNMANMLKPPQVISISYGSYELSMSKSYIKAFDVEAMKLGMMGVTLVAASGDDGVSGFMARNGNIPCDYYADFPASSPYVTAVGGTMVTDVMTYDPTYYCLIVIKFIYYKDNTYDLIYSIC